jgi:hypothetical protein
MVAAPSNDLGDQHLFVVSAGNPPADGSDDRNFARWVGANSWAVAMFAACLQAKVGPPFIRVLDLSSTNSVGSPIPSDFGNTVQCYSPHNSPEAGFFLDGFVTELIEIHNTTSHATHLDDIDNKRGICIYWRQLCAALAPASDDSASRHDVSNQIGAMIMRAGLPVTQRQEWVAYRPRAGRLEKNAALLVDRLASSTESSPPASDITLFPPQGLKNPPKIMLVDDRYLDGYLDVLKAALASDVTGRLGVLSDDGSSLDSEATSQSSLFGMTLTNSLRLRAFDNLDVLFLDLRLWSKDSKREEATLNNYCLVAEKLCKEWNVSGDERSWPHFLPLLDQAMRARSQVGSHRSLAMLPLIISGLDPSLPIILFSSTQHRSVIQAVRGCPNIITDFTKPYIGSDDADASEPAVIMEGLKLAVGRARAHLEIRQVWMEAVREWEGLSSSLKWHADWPPIMLDKQPDLHPALWLRNEWLPLAQRGGYELAAATPWLYIRKLLGDTRIAILNRDQGRTTVEPKEYLRIIQDAQFMPLIDKKPDAVMRELAVVAAIAFVRLVALWAKP